LVDAVNSVVADLQVGKRRGQGGISRPFFIGDQPLSLAAGR